MPPPIPPLPPGAPLARNTRPFLTGLGLALGVIIPILVVTAMRGGDPVAAGERAGELSVAPLLGGVAVAVWARLARRRWNALDYLLRFVLCTTGAFALNAIGRSASRVAAPRTAARPAATVALTDAEKQNLFVGRASARHADFGFTFNHPGGFVMAPEIQDQVNQRLAATPGMFAWALQHPGRDGIILVFVAKGLGSDEATFRGMARGMRRSAAQGVEVLEDAVEWSEGGREFRHGFRLTDGTYVRTRCLPSRGDEARQYIVCLQTRSSDATGLDVVRQQMRAASWNWDR